MATHHKPYTHELNVHCYVKDIRVKVSAYKYTCCIFAADMNAETVRVIAYVYTCQILNIISVMSAKKSSSLLANTDAELLGTLHIYR